jgi:hypothetical protein
MLLSDSAQRRACDRELCAVVSNGKFKFRFARFVLCVAMRAAHVAYSVTTS